jgi:hypothetical protein
MRGPWENTEVPHTDRSATRNDRAPSFDLKQFSAARASQAGRRPLRSDYAPQHRLPPYRLDVHRVLLLEFDPIPTSIQDHAHTVLIEHAVELEARKGSPEKPPRNALFEVPVVQATKAEVVRILVQGFVLLLTPPATTRHGMGLRGGALIPLRVTHTLLSGFQSLFALSPCVGS